MYSLHGDVQASHVTFTRSVVFGDVLLHEIPSPRPRLCSKVDELSNATGTDTVDLGDMGTVGGRWWMMVKMVKNINILWDAYGGGVQQRMDLYTPVN